MISNQHFRVLKTIVFYLKDHPIHWAVTGSLGMALQGMSLDVHDIDLQTDRDGAFEIEHILSRYVVNAVCFCESERIRSYLGMLEIDGIQVEIMGDIQKRLEDQTWEEPVKVDLHRQWVEVEGMQVPVLSLTYEYQAYLRMGRIEKAEMIKDWLQKKGSALSG